ncbi:MAG: recombinase family protein [Deltaproteobacteria bacterium]|nr:recombinase family protein [Deltaproteobacteria bacterium]
MDAAPIVKRIYQMTIDGKGITQIAGILSAERVLIPTAYWARIGADNCRSYPNAEPYNFGGKMVSKTLSNARNIWAGAF